MYLRDTVVESHVLFLRWKLIANSLMALVKDEDGIDQAGIEGHTEVDVSHSDKSRQTMLLTV